MRTSEGGLRRAQRDNVAQQRPEGRLSKISVILSHRPDLRNLLEKAGFFSSVAKRMRTSEGGLRRAQRDNVAQQRPEGRLSKISVILSHRPDLRNLLEKAGFFSSVGKRRCKTRAHADGMDGSQSRCTHPCALGPRRPCRGTLCSSVHAIRVSTEALFV